ncbi:MAG: Uma2 family endonuclease [Planctomycetes bacterium]|nr:Uma2 family endonuclease [Planctomycetota bacterium]
METIKTTGQPSTGTNGVPAVLTLQNGDHLTRQEFERRYEAMPNLKKAELIEGVVQMPSPVRFRKHSKPQFHVIGWMATYVAATPGTDGGDNGTLRLDLKNEPQPDGFVIIAPECGGQVKFDEEDYVIGAPELIGEVSASSASYDLHTKLEAYRRNGVKEYVVWRVLERAIDWFVLEGEDYARLPCEDGIYRSRVFPGLWLDTQALIDGRLADVLQVVQQGIATQEHRDFVEQLKRRLQTP